MPVIDWKLHINTLEDEELHLGCLFWLLRSLSHTHTHTHTHQLHEALSSIKMTQDIMCFLSVRSCRNACERVRVSALSQSECVYVRGRVREIDWEISRGWGEHQRVKWDQSSIRGGSEQTDKSPSVWIWWDATVNPLRTERKEVRVQSAVWSPSPSWTCCRRWGPRC